MAKGKNFKRSEFTDTTRLNDATYFEYLERFKRIALSLFEWVNLPDSMNERYLEECLYYKGQASLLYDSNYGYINTQCCSNGYINIYGLPSSLNCYSFSYQTDRRLYTGLNDDESKEKDCILVMNNYERIPTAYSMELFAYRLYEAQRTCDVNIKSQKFPVLLIVNEKQRLTMENLYEQYAGNRPVIFGDKDSLQEGVIKVLNTEAPFVIDKITDYKKEIWNEALSFLGINNLEVNKKERLVTDEASSNNELVNLNLQAMLVPRQKACDEFNKLFNLEGDKKISVRVRSDLHNIIKENESIVADYNFNGIPDNEEDDINE